MGIVRYRLAKCLKCSYGRELKKNSFKGKAFPNINTLMYYIRLHTYYQLDIIYGKNITVLQYSGDPLLRTDLLYIVWHFFSHSQELYYYSQSGYHRYPLPILLLVTGKIGNWSY